MIGSVPAFATQFCFCSGLACRSVLRRPLDLSFYEFLTSRSWRSSNPQKRLCIQDATPRYAAKKALWSTWAVLQKKRS